MAKSSQYMKRNKSGGGNNSSKPTSTPIRTNYTLKELGKFTRAQLDKIGREVARKNAKRNNISESEAIRRYNLLNPHNTTRQLMKYINKNGK